MFEEISFNGTRICDFKVDPRTVYASGLHTCASLIFTATPYNLSPIQLSTNEKKHYSVVNHDSPTSTDQMSRSWYIDYSIRPL